MLFYQLGAHNGIPLCLLLLLFYPLVMKLFFEIFKKKLIKDYLFICGVMLNLELLSTGFVFKSRNLY